MQSNTLNMMVSVQFFQVCKISGGKQENIVVATPGNKELLALSIFSFFFVDLSVKF